MLLERTLAMRLSVPTFCRRHVPLVATFVALAAAAAAIAIVPPPLRIATACAFAPCAALIAAILSRYQKRSCRDALTGLVGAASFGILARRMMAGQTHVQSLVVIRVDRHAEIALLHGDERCDAALRAVAHVVERVAGARAPVGRIGDEFAALLSTATAAEALLAAGRIHRALDCMKNSGDLAGLAMTVSIGVASGNGGGFDELLTRAHGALRQATQKGGNRTSSLQNVVGLRTQQSAA